MYKRFIVLLGIILGGHAAGAAQTSAPLIVLAHEQEHVAATTPMLRTVTIPLLSASPVLNLDPGKFPARFSLVFRGAAEGDHGPEGFPELQQFKTFLYTQTSLPLVQLWGGRLQLDVFQSTFHIQNMQPGPMGLVRSQGQSYPGGPRSSQISGLSLSFQFGRGARGGRPSELWRDVTRIAGNVLN
jgi:hypothetical protein